MKKLILFSLALTVIISCSKRFDDLNINPNSPNDVPSQMLLANVMVSSAYSLELRSSLIITDQWVQYTKSTTYMEEDTYNARNDRMDAIWSNLYNQAFEDCVLAIEKAKKDGQPDNEAVGLIMKGYLGYNLTMLFGDVPYSQACQASQNIITPAYDPQLTVLNSVIVDLDNAIALIGTTTDATAVEELATYDYIYGGRMDRWKMFANGLKLRIYLTMNAGGVDKTSEINALLASSDIFQSSDDEAKMAFVTSANPVYQWVNPNSSRRTDFRMSETIVNYMLGSSVDSTLPADTRLTIYANPVESGADSLKYVGGRNGETGGITTNSTIGSFYTATTPFYLMTYTELLFIKAEMDTANATKYQDAVTASFVQNGFTAADATTMLADPKFAFNPAIGGKLIGEQKWIALFGQGNEAFNSWRRTGYPKLTPAANATTINGYVPRRIAYNTDEHNLNSANLNTGVSNLSPADDRVSSQVWFDKTHSNNFGNN